MDSSLLQTLVLENSIIEIHHNENLNKSPYLIRMFSYTDGMIEWRTDALGVKILVLFIGSEAL